MQIWTKWTTALIITAALTLSAGWAQSPDEGLKRAAQALEQRNEVEAWRLFQRYSGRFNAAWRDLDWRFVSWVADQLRRERDFSGALELCARVMEREDEIEADLAAAILMVRGDVFRDQRNFAAARLEYAGVDRHPEYRRTEAGRRARFRMLEIMRITQDYENALQMVERLKDSREIDIQAEAYYQHAYIAFDRGDYEQARELIREVRIRKPEHVETVFLEGELNLAQNRLQDPELEIGERRLQTFVVPGRPIVIRMQDPNLAIARGGAGIPIEFHTSVGGDEERIMLMPSPRDPTMFRGSIRTVLGKAEPGNMTLELLGQDEVIYNIETAFQRANDLSYENKYMTVVADAELNVAAGDFMDREEADAIALQQRIARTAETDEDDGLRAFERIRDISTVRPGNPVYIQVTDLDRSVSVERDAVPVTVRASSGAEIEAFNLRETEPHSGIFRGSLPTMVPPPRARASDAAPGHDPDAVIDARRGRDFWRSTEDGERPEWLEVDLMKSAAIKSAEVAFAGDSKVTGVTLLAGRIGDELEPLGSTAPSRAVRYGFLNLGEYFGDLRNTAAYIYTEIDSPREQEATFKIGSADGVQCWVNAVSVHRTGRGRTWNPEEDVVTATLREGRNGIVLKVHQISGTWGASLSVVGERGECLGDSDKYPALASGVVTRWHVFDYPTDIDIEIPELVTVGRAVRVGEEFVRWVPESTAPQVSLILENERLKALFHEESGWRRLRWVFDEKVSSFVAVREVTVIDRFDEQLVPVDTALAEHAADLDKLAIGPGDTIEVLYHDELRTREDDGWLRESMHSGYFDAEVSFAYEKITTDDRGERVTVYDRALRYRPGHTETLVVRIIDYDSDITPERDTVTASISTTGGESLELEALETKGHSGEFIAILRLGQETDPENDTIGVRPGDDLKLFYYDTENSDGIPERISIVNDAGDDPPRMVLYQTSVLHDTEGLVGERGDIVRETRLPRGDPQARGEPVITSLEAPLRFDVHYPMAALSENAVLPVRLLTKTEQEQAEQAGREPRFVEVNMRLRLVEEAVFSAEVPLKLGDAAMETMTVSLAGRRQEAVLPVRGAEDVIVEVDALNPGAVHRAVFRLASDGRVTFTDRRYDQKVEGIHAGDYLYVRVEDPARSVSDGLDEIELTLATATDSVHLTLTETMPNAGIFTGRLRTELAVGDDSAGARADGNPEILYVKHGERISASYEDPLSVLTAQPRQVTALVAVFHGDDGEVSSFTRRFRDDDMAMRTRLLKAEALFEMAKRHQQSGLEDLAEEGMREGKELLEAAIVGFPGAEFASQAEYLLANLAHEVEEYEQALERYNRLLAVWPDSEYAPQALLRKAQTLEAMGEDVTAADTYVELTYTYPDSALVADAVVRLGQHFYRREKYSVAGQVFANFERNYPENQLAPRALFLAGQSFMKAAEERKEKLELERYDRQCSDYFTEAIDNFDRLIISYEAERDLRAESLYWAGDIHVKLGNMQEAYQMFTRLRWDYPESNWANFARGRLTDRVFQAIEQSR